MVIFFFGTTGETIKLLPLFKNFPADKTLTISTNQQTEQLARFYQDTNTKKADIAIGRKLTDEKDLEKLHQVPLWAGRIITGFPKLRAKVYKEMKARGETKKQTVMVVHGDTMTTVLGAMFGRYCGFEVAHVESGLRSFNWIHPFPEELDRMIVSRIARIHFAPGETPIKNLNRAKVKGDIIDTKFNTVLDSMWIAKDAGIKSPVSHLEDGYCLVSIHRQELLARPKELEKLLQILDEHSKSHDVVFIDHPVTTARIKELKLDKYLHGKKMLRVPKLSYLQFITVVSKSGYIVTDSGGLQEEASYLGIPCLIHRKATERTEGLGKFAVLSMYDEKAVREFLDNPSRYRTSGVAESVSKPAGQKSPTGIIQAEFKKRGYL